MIIPLNIDDNQATLLRRAISEFRAKIKDHSGYRKWDVIEMLDQVYQQIPSTERLLNGLYCCNVEIEGKQVEVIYRFEDTFK